MKRLDNIAASDWRWAIASLAVSAALCVTLIWRPRPLLLWNASSSSVVGFYSLSSAKALKRGDTVVAWAPAAARELAARRSYLPLNVPLVKHVAAVQGDRVCAIGDRVTINSRAAAARRSRDPSGRAMPRWSGCSTLRRGEVFLLSANRPLAFDGRYFGLTRTADLIGKAHLLWPR